MTAKGELYGQRVRQVQEPCSHSNGWLPRLLNSDFWPVGIKSTTHCNLLERFKNI
jgi:hypothetical protein